MESNETFYEDYYEDYIDEESYRLKSIKKDWIFGQSMCKAFLIVNGVNQFASSVFMAVLALDRYLAICHAVRSTTYRTIRSAVILCGIAWGVVIIEMIPLLKHAQLVNIPLSEKEESKQNSMRCMLYWNSDNSTLNENLIFSRRFFTAYCFFLTYTIPMGGIFYCYGRIIVQMWGNHGHIFQHVSARKRRTQKKVTMMSVAIMLLYTLCWLPFWLVQWSIDTEAEWTRNHHILMPVSYVAYAMQYINSAVNPLFYIVLTDSSREKLCGPRRKHKGERLRPQSYLQLEMDAVPPSTQNPLTMTTSAD
uniref:G_PROTEIN_RECEP_F1_2 domain-containing protein n=1 Tax=Steinernema glaseri TaxID=37863 RepID=A0A1I7YVF3_9BILA